jgi:hypothetical protein
MFNRGYFCIKSTKNPCDLSNRLSPYNTRLSEKKSITVVLMKAEIP